MKLFLGTSNIDVIENQNSAIFRVQKGRVQDTSYGLMCATYLKIDDQRLPI